MPVNSVRLALGVNALEIKAFTTYRPSWVGAGNGTTYSLNGSPIADGQSYEPKLFWELGCILETPDMLMLRTLFATSDRLRRSLVDYSLLIHDTITPIVEFGTVNTRAIVPTFAITPVGLNAVSYPAQYRGGFVTPPKIEAYPTGLWQCDFSIAEHDRVLP